MGMVGVTAFRVVGRNHQRCDGLVDGSESRYPDRADGVESVELECLECRVVELESGERRDWRSRTRHAAVPTGCDGFDVCFRFLEVWVYLYYFFEGLVVVVGWIGYICVFEGCLLGIGVEPMFFP